MTKLMIALAFGASVLAVQVSAQPQAQVISAIPTGAAVLRAGTTIPLRTREAITTSGGNKRYGV